MKAYDFKSVEKKWQDKWEVDGMEHTGVFPLVLPFFLDRFKVVGFHFSTVLYG